MTPLTFQPESPAQLFCHFKLPEVCSRVWHLSCRRLTRPVCALGSTGPLPGNAAELKVPPEPSPLESRLR